MNRVFVAILLITSAFSCKKEVEPWDKEGNLTTDTSLYLNSVKYVSHDGAEAIFDFEIVQFNKLDCEQVYSGIAIDEFDNSNLDLSVVSQYPETLIPFSDYSSIFLFEESGYELYYEGEASFLLRRYFEFIENNPTDKRIGMATFLSGDDSSINFYKEDGTLFGNSADYNDSVLVDLIHRSELYPNSIDYSGNGFMNVMCAAIEEIANNPEATGDKSITIFDDFENNLGPGYSIVVFDSVVNMAIANNVKINAVSLSGYRYAHMAIATGGWVIDQREANKVIFFNPEYALSSIGNNLANLDRILSQNLTVHKVRIMATKYYGVFNPGEIIYYDLQYGNDIFRQEFIIP